MSAKLGSEPRLERNASHATVGSKSVKEPAERKAGKPTEKKPAEKAVGRDVNKKQDVQKLGDHRVEAAGGHPVVEARHRDEDKRAQDLKSKETEIVEKKSRAKEKQEEAKKEEEIANKILEDLKGAMGDIQRREKEQARKAVDQKAAKNISESLKEEKNSIEKKEGEAMKMRDEARRKGLTATKSLDEARKDLALVTQALKRTANHQSRVAIPEAKRGTEKQENVKAGMEKAAVKKPADRKAKDSDSQRKEGEKRVGGDDRRKEDTEHAKQNGEPKQKGKAIVRSETKEAEKDTRGEDGKRDSKEETVESAKQPEQEQKAVERKKPPDARKKKDDSPKGKSSSKTRPKPSALVDSDVIKKSTQKPSPAKKAPQKAGAGIKASNSKTRKDEDGSTSDQTNTTTKTNRTVDSAEEEWKKSPECRQWKGVTRKNIEKQLQPMVDGAKKVLNDKLQSLVIVDPGERNQQEEVIYAQYNEAMAGIRAQADEIFGGHWRRELMRHRNQTPIDMVGGLSLQESRQGGKNQDLTMKVQDRRVREISTQPEIRINDSDRPISTPPYRGALDHDPIYAETIPLGHSLSTGSPGALPAVVQPYAKSGHRPRHSQGIPIVIPRSFFLNVPDHNTRPRSAPSKPDAFRNDWQSPVVSSNKPGNHSPISFHSTPERKHERLPPDDALVDRVTHVLEDSAAYKRLLSVTGTQAQSLLDTFQVLLDHGNLNASLRRSLVVAMKRLSSETDRYPSSFMLKDIKCENQLPVAWGGFALVFKGKHGGKHVCLKMIKVEPDRVDQLAKEYAQEAILWRQLSHRNLLPFYGLSRAIWSKLSFVSPWAENGHVVDFLAKNPNKDRVLLCSDVAGGIEYLHGHDIIHGDLKGKNILIDRSGRAYVADFGLAAVTDSRIPSWTAQSSAASKGGTARWQAPELFDPESYKIVHNTKESDVYAFSCTCYEILTGKLPFYEANNLSDITDRIRRKEHPSPPSGTTVAWLKWGLTAHLWGLMKECWEYDPSQRPKIGTIIPRLAKAQGKDRRPPGEWVESVRSRSDDANADQHIVTSEEFDAILSGVGF